MTRDGGREPGWRRHPSGPTTTTRLGELLRATLGPLKPPSYVAIQAFVAPSPEVDAALAALRVALAATGCATTAGYGPRFLHSTGQLHKGGPPTGVFLQLTADHPDDREIPGWPYTFGQLIDAQAHGDRAALSRGHDRPVIHVHLGATSTNDLATLERAITRALATNGGSEMQLGFIGLGRMGANMVRRLMRDGHEIVAYNRTSRRPRRWPTDRGRPTRSPSRSPSSSRSSTKPRAVWIMVPAGDATEAQIKELLEHLEPGDTIIDGGNTNFHDDVRRHAELATKGIHYVDAGVSGGIWGLANGFCLMVGGEPEAVGPLEPIFRSLAPEDGYLHVGGPGRATT